ncbi:hypothetical protein QOZ80_9BG0697760 [Eleusine coracana subsp. coracana]|nr:hypothetical protein QOZ80_9BG0697760 [Eleusine coracana subsp. coracana]
MYIDKVDHDCKVDPELVSDLGLPYESGNNSATATEADKKVAQNQSGNWDMNIEKPAESNNSGLDLTSIPDSTWEMKPKSFPVWGDSNYGWSDAPGDPSWYYSSNNHYPSNNWNVLNAGSNNGFQEWSNKSGRKHNGGHFQHRNSRQRNQTEGYQRSGWQDHRGRHSEWRPVQNRDRQNGQGADRGF